MIIEEILELAVSKNASDIHFDPADNHMKVRFRIDGILMEHLKTNVMLSNLSATVSRIKSQTDIFSTTL